MLNKGTEFVNRVDSLTEKMMKSLVFRASSVKKNTEIVQSLKLLREKKLRGLQVRLF